MAKAIRGGLVVFVVMTVLFGLRGDLELILDLGRMAGGEEIAIEIPSRRYFVR